MFYVDFLAGSPFAGLGTFLSGANGGGAHDGGAGKYLFKPGNLSGSAPHVPPEYGP